MSWVDDVMDLLCRIYKDLGGDCKDLYNPPGVPVPKKVVEQYQITGAPSFPDAQAKADFLTNLDKLEGMLLDTANTFSDSDTPALVGMIADLRKDLGAS